MMSCPYCDEPIGPFELTDTVNDFEKGPVRWHWECAARMVVGSVGHQKRKCGCYGGAEDDPPNMTKRQAAGAALRYFHNMNLRRRRLGASA